MRYGRTHTALGDYQTPKIQPSTSAILRWWGSILWAAVRFEAAVTISSLQPPGDSKVLLVGCSPLSWECSAPKRPVNFSDYRAIWRRSANDDGNRQGNDGQWSGKLCFSKYCRGNEKPWSMPTRVGGPLKVSRPAILRFLCASSICTECGGSTCCGVDWLSPR